MKAYILGCAKSGTTLLLHLMHAFAEAEVLYGRKGTEISVADICSANAGRHALVVGKRLWNTVLSDEIPEAKADAQQGDLHRAGVRCIVVERDGRDVVCSDDGYVPASRWCHCVEELTRRGDSMKPLILKYEDILTDPDGTQAWFAEELGVTIRHKWSEFPKWLPSDLPAPAGSNYAPRPLDPSRIGASGEAWRERVRPEDMDRFMDCMRTAGYL